MMGRLKWPVWLDDIWAKSPKVKGKAGETLAHHTWSVLENLANRIRLRPYLPDMVGISGLWNALFWACWIHDFGKAACGFQDWLRGGLCWPHRHEVLSLGYLDWFEGLFTPEEELLVAAAVAFHHKDTQEVERLYLGIGPCSKEAVEQLVVGMSADSLEKLWRWLDGCALSWIQELGLTAYGVKPPELVPLDKAINISQENAASAIQNRIRRLRRWVKELEQPKGRSFVPGVLALRGYINSCDHTASAHVASLQQDFPSPDEMLAGWGILRENLYPHQVACLKIKRSVILIAPTGSGKTEAALLWAISCTSSNRPFPRLFYTLPYQASMNAMYDRLRKSFPGQVGLEHSRSVLAMYRRFLDDNYGQKQAVILAHLGKNLSRLHYYPIRVLSPYQMLKGPYRLKGYEELLTDYFGAAVIFDEVHAYETRRLATILATVKYLRENFGVHFFVMSATLPGILLNRLFEVSGEPEILRAAPEVFAAFQRHRLHICKGNLLEWRWLERVAQDATGGYSVLVCCNTVKRAQQVYDEMIERLDGRVEILLLHGRFNGRDRLAKECRIQSAGGSRSTNRRPVLLVATQVIEVSLDLDFDFLYTDPAPLEALVQRFGRVNRRRLKKEAPVFVFTEPIARSIYQEKLVKRALEILVRYDGQMLDEGSIGGLLDEIYQGEIAEGWNQEYEQVFQEFTSACLQTLCAFDSNKNLEEMFYRAFDSIEVLPVCLEDEYLALIESGKSLEASQLLVPLSWNQFARLQNIGKAWKCSKYPGVNVVEASYSRKTGLLTQSIF